MTGDLIERAVAIGDFGCRDLEVHDLKQITAECQQP
jgi:hypothetical protein